MATPRPPRVVLSERERSELERLVRAFTTGQQLALRARIVLAAGDGVNNLPIARELGVSAEPPGELRRAWVFTGRLGVPYHRSGVGGTSGRQSTDQPMDPPRVGG